MGQVRGPGRTCLQAGSVVDCNSSESDRCDAVAFTGVAGSLWMDMESFLPVMCPVRGAVEVQEICSRKTTTS